MNIYEKLAAVQQELKAPKDKKNTFAGYSYRSAEGILEAVKPVLSKYKATIVLSDDIVEVGGRVYVRATATFRNIETIPVTECTYDEDEKESKTMWEGFQKAIVTTAYAREAEEKKGLDVSQVTGTASSYARKYALNGLLLIDDTKDPDSDEYAKQTGSDNTREKAPNSPVKPSETVKRATEPQIKTIRLLAEKAGLNIDTITKKPLDMFTPEEATKLMLELRKKVPSEA